MTDSGDPGAVRTLEVARLVGDRSYVLAEGRAGETWKFLRVVVRINAGEARATYRVDCGGQRVGSFSRLDHAVFAYNRA